MASPHLLYLCLETIDAGRAAQTHVTGIVEALRGLGWQVTLVADTGPRRGGLLSQLHRYIALNMRAVEALGDVDAVYIRSHFAAWPLAFGAFLARKPVFHEVNGVPDELAVTYPAFRRAMPFLRGLYRWQFAHAAHLFAVTEGLAAFAARFAGHSRVTMVPNGVDIDRFTPADLPRPPRAPERDYAIFYGDLARWHGLDLMFDALRHPIWPSTIDLLLIGRGSAANGPSVPPDLAGRLIWLDRLPQDALLPFLSNAKVGLVPVTNPGARSASGVMPLKLLEMMAAGVPVVVTNLPGQADLVEKSGAGIVVAQDDPAALADAVARIATDPHRAEMGKRGRAAVRESFGWPALAARIADTIADTILAARARPSD